MNHQEPSVWIREKLREQRAISATVDALSEEEAKSLLKLYICTEEVIRADAPVVHKEMN